MPDPREFLDRRFAARGGAMPFDEFMELALYDPEHGYYTTGIGDVGGRGGDFATSATLSPGLGRAIAGWMRAEIAHHGWRGAVDLVEIGGGNGALASAVRRALGWWRRRRLRYRLVEVSPVLRARQQERLGKGGSVFWHGTIGEALAACGGRALIVSNELVDAFPAKWLQWDGARWREIGVAYDPARGLGEVFGEEPRGLAWEEFSAMALENPPVGQRIEIQPAYRDWLGELAGEWRGGSILTIDYGAATADAIYSRRPGGTMRAYCKHERIEGAGVYARFGKQDLTCDVNFADLAAWGGALGWETAFLEPQARFFERFGVAEDAMGRGGPGDSFLVLSQRLTPARPPTSDL